MGGNFLPSVDDLTGRVLAGVVAPFLQTVLPTSLIWWPFLVSALAIAAPVYWLAHGRSAAALREFRRRFLGRAIWLHPSARADYAAYLVNAMLSPVIYAPLVVGGAAIGTGVSAGLAGAFGPLSTPWLGIGPARVLYTIAFFIAYDFGRYLAHSLQHEVPWLWEFHKVHHSAEVLTPFTNYRAHPFDLILLATIPNLTTGLVTGVVWYLSAAEVGVYTFLGLHVGIFAFNVIGNLRHWQVWISFGPVLNRWLISPAHHQIHHSREARHIGKNRGFELAIWDRLLGTLYAPVAEETFALGLGDGTDGAWHSLGRLYVWPFRHLLARLGLVTSRDVAAQAPPDAGRRRALSLGLAGAGLALLQPRPARAASPQTVFLEDLTWIELRDTIAAGAGVVLVPTGGTEQNGPHMALGKHNRIVRFTAGVIAKRLGNALVAPVIAYVPEGGFAPPDGHMAFPGTLGASEATFEGLLRDAATSLALAGFGLICFVGDHGASQPAQDRVAAGLTQAWRGRGIRVANLARYYAANGQEAWLRAQGFSAAEIGTHAGLLDTAELMALTPEDVRADLLSPAHWPSGKTGVAGDPSRATPQLGRALLELKIRAGVAEASEIRTAQR